MGREEFGERAGLQQRHVGAEHQDIAVEAVERVQGGLDRATGAGHVVLIDDHDARCQFRHGLGDELALVAHDHDDARGIEGCRGVEHVTHQGATAHGCSTFGRRERMRVP